MNISSTTTNPPPRKWTILQYSAGDNNLSSDLAEDVDDMETVGSDELTNLVVQLDVGGAQGARRYLLEKDAARGINSPVLEDMGAINMSDPATLSDFIQWGIRNYPAEHYLLILSDHGDAWRGACEDDSHNDWMSLPQIQQGLASAREQTGVKLDILGFDACNMAALEVAYQLRDEADYMVASEKTEGADGWPYASWLVDGGGLQRFEKSIHLDVDLSPRDLAAQIVEASSHHQDVIGTLSATDLHQMEGVAAALDRLSGALLSTSTNIHHLREAVSSTKAFEGHRDACDFATNLLDHSGVSDPSLKEAATRLIEAVEGAVVAEQHSEDNRGAHGLTVELQASSEPGPEYQQLAIVADTRWGEAQKSLAAEITLPPPDGPW